MFERRLPHGAVAFVAATFFGLSGCSSAAKSGDSPASGAARPNGPSGDATGATSIAFSDPSVVLIPGQARTLSLTVEPAATYTVRLALVGDAADAYLDASEVVTDDAGKRWFTLTAPSSPKTFSVRASVGALSTEIQATPAPGYTTVEVVPVYSGHRKITDWVGTVSIGSSCDATIVPPPDGPLSATAPDHPRIGDVPLGTPLTVTIRAGHFAGGCVELSRVVADGADGVYTVSVPVQDRPLALDGVSVPLVLGVDTTQGWSSVWQDLATSVQNAFCPPLETDVSALLDAMHDSTPTGSQGEFTAARTLHAWDEKLVLSLDAGLAKHGLDDAVNRWISDGLKMLSDSPLVGRLSTNSSAAPTLTFSNVGGFLPKDVGFPAALADGVSLTASPDDHVVFGATTPSFQPAKIAAALALSSARTEFPDAKSVPDALASLVGCTNVGTILVGAGSIGYGTCGASCLAQRCDDALAAMWANASTTGDTATLEISGSAAVTSLGDVATPLSLDGTWVGTMQVGTSSTHVGGAVASAPAATP